MEKRISLERWQEAWGRPGERKLQEKDIRKKRRGWKRRNVGLEMVKSRNTLKGKKCVFYFIFIFLLYWSVGKCTFLFFVGKPIKLAPDERVSLILVEWNFPYNTLTYFGRSIVNHCNIISWKHGLQRNGWWSAPSKKKYFVTKLHACTSTYDFFPQIARMYCLSSV